MKNFPVGYLPGWNFFIHFKLFSIPVYKHSFCARDWQVCSAASFHFPFFPELSPSRDEVFLNLSSFPCIFTSTVKIVHTKYKLKR